MPVYAEPEGTIKLIDEIAAVESQAEESSSIAPKLVFALEPISVFATLYFYVFA